MKLRTIFSTVAVAILMGCVILFSTSCVGVTALLETAEGQAIIEHGGIIAGVFVGSNNIDKIDEIVEKCDTYLKEDNIPLRQAAMEAAYLYVFNKFGQTPQTMIVMAEVNQLAGVFIKDGELGFLDNYKPELIGKFMLAFRNGVSLATPRHTKFIRR